MWNKRLIFRSTFVKLFIFLMILVVSSCEKVIQVKLDEAPNKFVIEGIITEGRAPQTVKLTRTVPFTETNSFPAVQGAVVTVTDNAGSTFILPESAQPGIYIRSFTARAGRTYSLSVDVDGKTYSASSTMPSPVVMDSLSVREFSFGGDLSKQIQAHYRDPISIVNNYRFLLFINGKQANSVYAENDRFTDGNFVKSLLFHDDETDGKLKSGDTVIVVMQCIDPSVFTYWYTLAQQSMRGPGGGTAPGNPPSNISNGALGYFSAQAQTSLILTIQ
jgi:hypothetical protein